ncbi:hypothetical protein M4I21_06265 [Cellulophaga sp. 20_2_10]|uniref:hypothetical protein n=1 Tax=Cellulophaga sp. 20_2_10 TaxID=2942476 RepID=UPI00201AEF39|nr:hypothetical protein [Cellulophaga sp. 20_2_10]MCL5245404.1 hypothetical protein [Cellulophaga sp. 20_2_10]
MYDTGSSGFNIDHQFARKNHIDLTKKDITISLGDTFNRYLTKEDNIRSVLVNEYDSNAFHKATINLDFFKQFNVKVDYHKKRITLSTNEEQNLDQSNSILLSKNKDNLYLYGFYEIYGTVTIADTVISGHFMLDTGNGRYVTLLNYPNNNLNELKKSIVNNFSYVNVAMLTAHSNGLNNTLITNKTKVLIGTKTYNGVLVDIANTTLNNFPNNKFIGFIGGGMLKHFSIYSNQNRLILEQSRDNVKVASELITDGFKIIKRGKKAFVSTTFTNKTNTSEVSLNDQVLEINNTPVKDLNNTEIEQLKTKLGNVISYKLKRKKNIFFIKTKVKNYLE